MSINMKTTELKSQNLLYKPPSREDYEVLRNTRPCDEFYLMVGESVDDHKYKTDEQFESNFVAALERDNYWYIFRGSEVIGVVFIHSINLTDKHGRYAVGIYHEANWNQGLGQEICKTVLAYAFDELGLHKVDLRVLEYNTRAIASYKKSGFIVDGRLRENAYINHRWHDDVLMSILSREYYALR